MITPSRPTIDLDRAVVNARSVAESAGVQIRMLDDIEDFAAASRLLDEIWGANSTPQMPVEHLRALRHAGNYAAGAFVDGAMVAASVGFFGRPAERLVHSHITGVSREARGRGTGYALKLHQRAWALGLGVERITWTFDPVVRRNAYFNLHKLGATPASYHVDFYGQADDRINTGQGTDRLLVVWDLDSDRVREALGEVGHAHEARLDDNDGLPAIVVAASRPQVVDRSHQDGSAVVLVGTPPDIEALRRSDPETSFAWRLAIREALGDLVGTGAHFRGFSPTGSYHFERNAQ